MQIQVKYGLCLLVIQGEGLFKSYPLVFDWVRDNGYRMTWRPHILSFEDKREV